MSRLLICAGVFSLALPLEGCSESQSRSEVDGSSVKSSASNSATAPLPGRIGSSEAGADSTGSVFYIPDDEIAATADSAEKGDNVALMRMINHYRFSYEGEDKDALSEKWEKIGADRAETVPLRSGEEIIAAINNNVPAHEIEKMDIGKKLRGVSANYFRISLHKGEDCPVLKFYADKAKRLNPDASDEISRQFKGACNIK